MIHRGVKDRDISALFRVSLKTTSPEFRNVVTFSGTAPNPSTSPIMLMAAACAEDTLIKVCARCAFHDITWRDFSERDTSPSYDLYTHIAFLAEQVLGPMTDVENVEFLKRRLDDGDRFQRILTSATVDDIFIPRTSASATRSQSSRQPAFAGFGCQGARGQVEDKDGVVFVRREWLCGDTFAKRICWHPCAIREEKAQLPSESGHHGINESVAVTPRNCIYEDALDNSWRLSSYGMRFYRAWSPHGSKVSVTRLVNIARQRAVLLKHEHSCLFSDLYV